MNTLNLSTINVLSRSEMKEIKGGDTDCLICSTMGGSQVHEVHFPEGHYQMDPSEMCELQFGGPTLGLEDGGISGSWGICPS